MAYDQDDSSSSAERRSTTRRQVLKEIVHRWRIYREPYSHFAHATTPRWALYGYLPDGQKIIMATYGRTQRADHTVDLIEFFLKDSQPEVAAILAKDLQFLLENLQGLEECEEMIPAHGSS